MLTTCGGPPPIFTCIKALREKARQKDGLPPIQYFVFQDDPDGPRLRVEDRGGAVYITIPNVMPQRGEA